MVIKNVLVNIRHKKSHPPAGGWDRNKYFTGN